MIVGGFVVGFAIGMVVGGSMAYEKGWRAGIALMRARLGY